MFNRFIRLDRSRRSSIVRGIALARGFVIASAAWISVAPQAAAIGPFATFHAPAGGGEFGGTLVRAGDVNGDGYADFLIGDPDGEDPADAQADEGVVRAYYGGPGGLDLTADWTVDGDIAGIHFGRVLCGAGDVNGDGFGDVLVTAPNYSNGQADEGLIQLFYGSASGLATTSSWSFESDSIGAQIGWFLTALGDVNSDGFADIGLIDKNFALSCAFYGSTTGLPGAPSWVWSSTGQGEGGMAGVGDVSGDGVDDILVAGFDSVAGFSKTWLFRGGAAGLAAAPVTTFVGVAGCSKLRVAAGGDLNGDGEPDALIGDLCSHTLKVYRGNGFGLSAMLAPASGFEPASALDFPKALAGGFDFEGDGYDDVLVGDPDSDSVFLFRGGKKGLGELPAETFVAPVDTTVSPAYGTSVDFAGDIDADGDSEIMIGDPDGDSLAEAGVDDDGRAYVRLGEPVNSTVATEFVPGDRLETSFLSITDTAIAKFSGVKAAKLTLQFDPAGGQKVGVRLIDPLGKFESNDVVKLGGQSVKLVLKLARDGLYAIEFEQKTGLAFQLGVATTQKLPKKALAATYTLDVKPGTHTSKIDVLALPGATLDATATPTGAVTQLDAVLTNPMGTELGLDAYQTGDLTSLAIDDAPLNAYGKYRLSFTVTAASKTKLTVTITPTQPALGSSTVTLP